MSVSDLSRVVDSVSDFKTRKQRLSCWSRTVNYYIAKTPKPKTKKQGLSPLLPFVLGIGRQIRVFK